MAGVREEWVWEKIRGAWEVREGSVSEVWNHWSSCGEGVRVGPVPVGVDSSV